MRHTFRHRFVAVIETETDYDPTKPESYMAALAKADETRQALVKLGATLTADKGCPVQVRE